MKPSVFLLVKIFLFRVYSRRFLLNFLFSWIEISSWVIWIFIFIPFSIRHSLKTRSEKLNTRWSRDKQRVRVLLGTYGLEKAMKGEKGPKEAMETATTRPVWCLGFNAASSFASALLSCKCSLCFCCSLIKSGVNWCGWGFPIL